SRRGAPVRRRGAPVSARPGRVQQASRGGLASLSRPSSSSSGPASSASARVWRTANRCPKCNYIVDNVDQLYPNFLAQSRKNMDLANINLMLELLVQKKKQLEA
ncbi:unnamed protein product, partial [Lota lota]